MVRTYDPFEYEHFPPVALYDMAADPFQTHDVAEEQPHRVAELDHLLSAWWQEQQTRPDAIDDPLLAVLHRRQRQRAP
jgi:hypothetical protein